MIQSLTQRVYFLSLKLFVQIKLGPPFEFSVEYIVIKTIVVEIRLETAIGVSF